MAKIECFDRAVAIGVDIQNDFCPGGSLAVSDGDYVVNPFNQVADWTRDNGGVVAFTRDWHPTDTSHFEVWPVHCVASTPGADFHPELVVLPSDQIVSKGMDAGRDGYSGFEGTTPEGMTLEEIITPTKKEKVAVFVGGLATDYCVKATVLDALNLAETVVDGSVEVFVVADAVRAVNVQPEDGGEAIVEMAAAGARFVTSHDVVNSLTAKVAA